MNAGKILIVEGDMTLSEVLGSRLEGLGHTIMTHQTGAKALEELRKQWVDLLIISINLQGEMDGYSLLKEIKSEKDLARIPVLVSASKPGMREVFEGLGIDAFFEKPYSLDDFQKKVEEVLLKKRQVDLDRI